MEALRTTATRPGTCSTDKRAGSRTTRAVKLFV